MEVTEIPTHRDVFPSGSGCRLVFREVGVETDRGRGREFGTDRCEKRNGLYGKGERRIDRLKA